jgi:hypothetical protein
VTRAGAAAGGAGWLSPKVVFPVLAALVLIVALLSPAGGERSGDPRLTTRSPAAQGARGLYELAARLGWRPERRDVSLLARDPRTGGVPLDSAAVYALLDPPNDVTAAEAGALLAEVRRGAGLLVVLRRGSTLADSLGVRPSRGGAPQIVDSAADSLDGCPPRERFGFINWPDQRVYSYWLVPRAPLLPADSVVFASVLIARSEARAEKGDSARAADGRNDRQVAMRQPAALGFRLGAGRVVAVADPDWLRNDVLRVCRWNAAVQAVRMLEYLSGGAPRARLVFDEYHQGFGRQPSTVRAIGRALTGDPRGRAMLQALAAALVLLAALGARPLAPRPRARLERRSPLEHVGALSRAYAQVGATRLATRRLVRGIRRRHGAWGTFGGGARAAGGAGGGAGESDDVFLAAVADRFPAVASDVALLRDAARTPRTPAAFLDVGRAAERVEEALGGRESGLGSRKQPRAESTQPRAESEP